MLSDIKNLLLQLYKFVQYLKDITPNIKIYIHVDICAYVGVCVVFVLCYIGSVKCQFV